MKHVGLRSNDKDIASQEQLGNIVFIYPNGGSSGSPASVVSNSRYVNANPWPGSRVVCRAELLIDGVWGAAGWWTDGTQARGTQAAQYGDDIVVSTGIGGVLTGGGGGGNRSAWGGGSFPGLGSTLTTAPCRVVVWKV